MQQLLASFAYGKVVHEGLTLAIVGRPNVGKSSLFNRLVEHERAIVTATPGTTRDLVTETVSIGGIPVRLVDTAGIRDALDEAESIGVRKSMEALADADIVLVVLEAGGASAADAQAGCRMLNAPGRSQTHRCDQQSRSRRHRQSESTDRDPARARRRPSHQPLERQFGVHLGYNR